MEILKLINEWLSQFFFMAAFIAALGWFGFGVVEGIQFIRTRWKRTNKADIQKHNDK